jgi:hypothetical protein
MLHPSVCFGGLMPICDGCGERVEADHIRRRIERLELATRFRPIHIDLLLIDAAPPLRREDFLYDPRVLLEARSAVGQSYVRELAKLVGPPTHSNAQLESILAELQHRGFFLASAVECPMNDSENLLSAIRRLASTVVLRIQTSYRPKHVALLGKETRELIEALRASGWGDRLILDGGAPFTLAEPGPPQGERATTVGERLCAAIS